MRAPANTRRVLWELKMNKTMKKTIEKWWNRRNAAYSTMCNEEFTNGEVVLTHAGVLVMLLACCLAEWMGGV